MSIPSSLAPVVIPARSVLGRLCRPRSFVLLVVALISVALFSKALAVSPPPDGGYLNFNTAEGQDALFNLQNGVGNTAIGFQTLHQNTSGSSNTATGNQALRNNVSGNGNTAIGSLALVENNSDNNTACGVFALASNTSGSNNTATGFNALTSNTTGPFNTAMGESALLSNTTGDRNTAMGDGALIANSTGASNTAVGVSALRNNTTAAFNTAVGHDALVDNNGNFNTASGFQALLSNTIGHDNSAGGFQALANNRTGSSNIALGSKAGINLTTGSNNIEIGAPGVAAEANTIRIGKSGTQKKTFVAGIRGVTVASGVGVIVGTTGQLGTVLSSARFKEAIKPMDKASEAILQLKPVTFRYKQELDLQKATARVEAANSVPRVVSDNSAEFQAIRHRVPVDLKSFESCFEEQHMVPERETQARVDGANVEDLEALKVPSGRRS